MEQDHHQYPRISVVMPVYNGIRYLAAALESLAGQSCRVHEVVVVDDGSTDGSREILAMGLPGKFTFHNENIGVSGVILTAAKIASLAGYEFVVQCDADGQHPLPAVPQLLARARQDRIDLTIGSRFLKRGEGDRRAMRTTT